MSHEFKFMLLLVISIFVGFIYFMVNSSLVLRVEETSVDLSGVVVLKREPLYNNIELGYAEEVVTPGGITCSAPHNISTYEKTETNTVVFNLHPDLIPCLEKGSTYRVSRKYGVLRPYVTETTVH